MKKQVACTGCGEVHPRPRKDGTIPELKLKLDGTPADYREPKRNSIPEAENMRRQTQYRMTDQQRALAAENVSLIDWMVGRVVGRSRQGRRTQDDARSDAAVALCRAAALYDPARGTSFPTYASCAIAFTASRSMRSAAKTKSSPLTYDPEDAALGPEASCISREIASRLTAALDRLPSRQRVAVELRFGLDGRGERAHHEVARAIGVSVTSAQNITRSAIGALRTLIGETYD